MPILMSSERVLYLELRCRAAALLPLGLLGSTSRNMFWMHGDSMIVTRRRQRVRCVEPARTEAGREEAVKKQAGKGSPYFLTE